MSTPKIRPKVRLSIIQALGAGVVPSLGINHIQVGRALEIKAMLKSIEAIADGGSTFKIIAGDYGAGKTFFLHLVKHLALNQKLITISADLSPERRLVSSSGQARNLYSELMANLSTRASPDGNALQAIVEKFAGECLSESESRAAPVNEVINERLSVLTDYVGGWDFCKVLTIYCQAHQEGDQHKKSCALRWLRGEYSTKTDAKNDLGVRTFIDDSIVYDAIKLIAKFVQLAGYSGLMVLLDEGVNLYKIHNKAARTSNYEMILKMLNDTLQGGSNCENLGIFMGFTPEALFETRRGLCSYEALQTRLAPNRYAKSEELLDFNQPTLHLKSLSPEELFILLENVRLVFAGGNTDDLLVTDEEIAQFMAHCEKTIGSAYFQTPRQTIREFVSILSLLEAYPEKSWTDFVDKIDLSNDEPAGNSEIENSDYKEFTEVTL